MLFRFLLPLLTLIAVLPLAGCASRGGPVSYDVANFGAPDTVRQDVSGGGLIGKTDLVEVTVYQLPELNREYQVDNEGNIVMPLVGTVRSEGLTPTELAKEITARLAARYVRAPSVGVSVKQTLAQMVTVEGAVKKPGMFPIVGKISLLRAVALASGPDEDANTQRVVVFRQINGQRMAAAFDLSAIRSGLAPDPEIFGNDVVVMDGSRLSGAYRRLLEAIPLLYVFRLF